MKNKISDCPELRALDAFHRRSEDFRKVLMDDLEEAHNYLKTNDSQFARRTYCRRLMAFFEGTFRSMSRAAHAVGLKIKLVAEPMTPKELGKLASQLARSRKANEARKIADKITEGFYSGS